MNLNELAAEIHAENKLRGFDVSAEPFAQSAMLIVTELSEAVEADRSTKCAKCACTDWIESAYPESEDCEPEFCEAFRDKIKNTVEDELADALIRLLDLTAALGIDVDKHVRLKRRYNKSRPWKHGKLY